MSYLFKITVKTPRLHYICLTMDMPQAPTDSIMQTLPVTNKRSHTNTHEKKHIYNWTKMEIRLMTKIPNIHRIGKYQTP